MWTCLIFLVPKQSLGTAQGILACFQNVGMTIIPLLMASIHDHTKSYIWVEIAFIALGLVSLTFSTIVYRIDKKERGGLLQKVDAYPRFQNYLDKL
jgi:nitrate/nitrite transporter NarK